MNRLRKYLLDNAISYILTMRVQRSAQHALLEQQNYIPEGHVELLELVSEPLRIELHFELYSRILKCHPFSSRTRMSVHTLCNAFAIAPPQSWVCPQATSSSMLVKYHPNLKWFLFPLVSCSTT